MRAKSSGTRLAPDLEKRILDVLNARNDTRDRCARLPLVLAWLRQPCRRLAALSTAQESPHEVRGARWKRKGGPNRPL
jgi:hypothetical protein